MNQLDKIIIEFAWDWRAGCWTGVVRGRTSAFAKNRHVLALKIRHQLGDTMPLTANFTMKLIGNDKPRPS